jgi:hypothetical protein
MKTITKTYKLYEFKELNITAQEIAIYNHIMFELETMDNDNYFYHCVVKMENLQTPWFTSTHIYNEHKDDIIETIELNEYLFFEDGELIPVDYYPKEEGEFDGKEKSN